MQAVNRLVGVVQIKLKVEEATSQSDAAPIYLLDEVVAMAGSRSDTVRATADAVLRRLQNRSPVVKQKALRLVKHAGARGSGELRTALAQQSGLLRELTHFRCDPDPFTGDLVWKRVQEAARDALEAVHGPGPEAQAPGMQRDSALRGRIQGFGSDVGSSRGGGGGSGSGMVGFGSDSLGPSSGMLGFGSDSYQPASAYSSFSSAYAAPAQQASDGAPPGGTGGDGSVSLPGGGASLSGGAPPLSKGSSSAGGVGAAHPAEKRLVDRLCTPAGLRAAPEHGDLQAFVDGLAPLSGGAAAQLLEEKLVRGFGGGRGEEGCAYGDARAWQGEAGRAVRVRAKSDASLDESRASDKGPWQATLRALYAVQAAAAQGGGGGGGAACGELAAHFRTAPDALCRAAASPQASVRQQAQRVLGALGLDGGGGAGAVQPAAAAAPAAAPDLLGGVEEEGAGSDAETSAADLLEGLQLGPGQQTGGAPAAGAAAPPPAAPAAPPPSAVDLLASLDFGDAAAAPAANQGPLPLAIDLFGGGGLLQCPAAPLVSLGVPGATAPWPAGAAAAPAASSSGGGGGIGDLLGGLDLGPAVASPAGKQPLRAAGTPSLSQQPHPQPQPQQSLGSLVFSLHQQHPQQQPLHAATQQQQAPQAMPSLGYTTSLPAPLPAMGGQAMRPSSESAAALVLPHLACRAAQPCMLPVCAHVLSRATDAKPRVDAGGPGPSVGEIHAPGGGASFNFVSDHLNSLRRGK
eukprot:scaffold13.g169.t1